MNIVYHRHAISFKKDVQLRQCYIGEYIADASHGYEAIAHDFIVGRNTSPVGAVMVRTWSQALPRKGTVLDLGYGSGIPIEQTLAESGITVYGVDASVPVPLGHFAPSLTVMIPPA